MRALLSFFHSAVKNLSKVCFWITQLTISVMAVSVSYNVIMRYVFNQPTIWAEEVNNLLIVVIAALGTAEVMRTRSHISFTLVSQRLSVRKRKIIDTVVLIIALIWACIIAIKGFGFTQRCIQFGMRDSSPMLTPLALPYGILTLGISVLLLQLLSMIISNLFGSENGEREA